MTLLISFLPGDALSIGATTIRLNWNPPTLVLPDGSILQLTDIPAVLPTADVWVFLLPPRLEGAMTLGFRAPRDIAIVRLPAVGAQ